MGTWYQLFPKLIYGTAAVNHSPQKLEDAFQSIWYKLLPPLCVNRNITKEYRMLSLRYQGLALLNPSIDALSKKIHLLQVHWDTGSMSSMIYSVRHIKCFRWRLVSMAISVPNLLRYLVNLPHMDSSETSGNCYIDADFDIPLLHVHDHTLMDAVHDTGIFDKHEQEIINRYPHYKGVHSIGDMVCSDGLTIDLVVFTKEAF
jgi:hypothetical protein